MSSSAPTATTSAATVEGNAAALTEIHHDILETHILAKLDPQSLFTTSCVSSKLHDICRGENLWKQICKSIWPSINNPRVADIISSFPSGYRSFFTDSFPTLHHNFFTDGHRKTTELVSAVDIHYQNKPLFAKVVTSNTDSDAFLDAPFWIDLLSNETLKLPGKFDTEDETFLSRLGRDLNVSWIVIDPSGRMAANMSSSRPVLVRQHWVTGDIKVRYVKVLAGGRKGKPNEFVQCKIEVECVRRVGNGELHVGQVSLKIEDMDKSYLSGRDSLVILQDALESGERKRGRDGEEKEIYDKYLGKRKERREKLQKIERRLEMVDRATRISISMAMLFLLFGSLVS
ncbi:F-box domain-containing protein [Heracleum sosnowskyi]|uniref:F-box domain-containing protein n=1 Tax=Heracleum sosnowskyi TaxID=360622 RepID=A0AAD8LZX7_9APIA|nr:F-box domain-containing protein [Heracleum sosnowskyi]